MGTTRCGGRASPPKKTAGSEGQARWAPQKAGIERSISARMSSSEPGPASGRPAAAANEAAIARRERAPSGGSTAARDLWIRPSRLTQVPSCSGNKARGRTTSASAAARPLKAARATTKPPSGRSGTETIGGQYPAPGLSGFTRRARRAEQGARSPGVRFPEQGDKRRSGRRRQAPDRGGVPSAMRPGEDPRTEDDRRRPPLLQPGGHPGRLFIRGLTGLAGMVPLRRTRRGKGGQDIEQEVGRLAGSQPGRAPWPSDRDGTRPAPGRPAGRLTGRPDGEPGRGSGHRPRDFRPGRGWP